MAQRLTQGHIKRAIETQRANAQGLKGATNPQSVEMYKEYLAVIRALEAVLAAMQGNRVPLNCYSN